MRMDLTDKGEGKSMIRTQRSNGGRISAWIYKLLFYVIILYFFHLVLYIFYIYV